MSQSSESKTPWVLFALFLVLGIFLGMKLNSYIVSKDIKKQRIGGKIESVINVIEDNYVDTIDADKLSEDALLGMLKELDPHSVYIPARYFKEAEEEIEGNFEGIGIQFRMIKDTVVVIMPVSGGPSEKGGIKPGDRIITVDTSVVSGKGLSTEDIMEKIKGPKGTKVKLGIKRGVLKKLVNLEVERDVIPSNSVDIHFMVDKTIGYIKVSKFTRTTAEEFSKAMKDLEKRGMKKIMIDFRLNGGGLLGSCVNMADMFLEKGDMIVYTKGTHRETMEIKATGMGDYKDIPMVVLMDEWSASASEIFAGAIQDNDRGTIVGRRSFGKGLVQEQMDISDGSALRLTVARYYTPSGRSIQKPYVIGQNEDYEQEMIERYISGEMTGNDTSLHGDTTAYYTIKEKRKVFGGGGIMPDTMVPYKTSETYVYWNELSRKGLFYMFSFEYTDKNRLKIQEQYPTAESYINNFEIGEDVLSDFISYSEKNGVKTDINSYSMHKNRIKRMIKAYIANDIYDHKGFYPIYLPMEDEYIKGLSILRGMK